MQISYWMGTTSRASSTKTRIETDWPYDHSRPHFAHQEQVPRKQGLKLLIMNSGDELDGNIKSKFHENKDWNLQREICPGQATQPSSRASSTKTRIETPLEDHPYYKSQTSRASSTKTRIETQIGNPFLLQILQHQEQVPRKQGLKHSVLRSNLEAHIRHQEQVPRKQGLKRIVVRSIDALQLDIKSKFHENKDWNSWYIHGARPLPLFIKSKFHENKDWNTRYMAISCHPQKASRASSTKTRIET